jgi:hypothetical protein
LIGPKNFLGPKKGKKDKEKSFICIDTRCIAITQENLTSVKARGASSELRLMQLSVSFDI